MVMKTFKVKGMHCPSCEVLVEEGVAEVNGVTDVKASHKDGQVKVAFDGNESDVVKAIKDEGYEVE